jgi:hypothetical protein
MYEKLQPDIASVKSTRAVWKGLMVINFDNAISKGLAVDDSSKPTIHSFLGGRTGGYKF